VARCPHLYNTPNEYRGGSCSPTPLAAVHPDGTDVSTTLAGSLT
jgi:hypothetical protein